MRPVAAIATFGSLLLMLGACVSADASSDVHADADVADAADASDTASEETAAPGPISAVVGAGDAVSLLAERDELVVIDVRTPGEFAEGHLAGAELIDVQDPSFRAGVEALDRAVPYVVYCRSGNRSAVAVAVMEELGFVELYDAGGFADLARAGATVVG